MSISTIAQFPATNISTPARRMAEQLGNYRQGGTLTFIKSWVEPETIQDNVEAMNMAKKLQKILFDNDITLEKGAYRLSEGYRGLLVFKLGEEKHLLYIPCSEGMEIQKYVYSVE